ncbi:MAG: hypothetical protein H6581_01910 [Bacteroidia bacterium]|nr:hypothetical protein [Bacteroidia bacterium]
MKTFLLTCLFAFAGAVCFPNLQAQTATVAGSTSGPQMQTPPPTVPVSYVYRVLYEAQVPLNTPYQVLVSEYYNKNCKVSCVAVYPNGDMSFSVVYGGNVVIISIQGDD